MLEKLIHCEQKIEKNMSLKLYIVMGKVMSLQKILNRWSTLLSWHGPSKV